MINENPSVSSRAILVSVFMTFFVFFGRFGYDVGTSDQDEFMPLLVNLLDSAVLGNDWFVNAQLEGFSIRLPLVMVLKPLATLFSPSAAVLIVYICAFILVVTAVHLLVRFLFESDLVAVFATITGLGITKLWTLGGNDILTTMLVPSMVAWASALWALLAAVRGRPVRSGVLCGIAILMQPLIGIHMTLLCSVIVFAELFGERPYPGNKKYLLQALQIPAVAFVIGAAVIVPVFLDQYNQPLSAESLFIFTSVRAPHHFIPGSFNQVMTWRFFLLAVTGVVALFSFSPHNRTRRIMLAALFVTGLLLMTAYLNVSYLHITTLTKLQLFKFSVVGKLLLVMIISETVMNRLLPDQLRKRLSVWLTGARVWQISATAVLILIASAWTYAPLTARNLPAVSRAVSPDAELYAWIQKQSHLDDVFAVPPDHSGFAYYARRAQYVNFKAFPYHENDIQEWYRRIRTLASLSGTSFSESGMFLSDLNGVSGLKELVELYEHANDFSLYEFARREGIQYILRRTPVESSGTHQQIKRVFQNRQWHLYRIDSTK